MIEHIDTAAVILGILATVTAIVYGYITWTQTRDLPQTREEYLTELNLKLRSTVDTLLSDHDEDTHKIEALEDELADKNSQLFAADLRTRQITAELDHYRAVAPPRIQYTPKKLNSVQLRELRRALLDCFTQHSQWKTLLSDLGRDIDEIAIGDNLIDVAMKVLSTANNEGWIIELMTEAAVNRKDLTALQVLIEKLASALLGEGNGNGKKEK